MASVTRSFGRSLAGAATAFVVTPFVITALFGLVQALPTWPTFMAVLAVAAGLAVFRRDLRGVAVGMASAAIVHAAFLAWLFRSFADLERI